MKPNALFTTCGNALIALILAAGSAPSAEFPDDPSTPQQPMTAEQLSYILGEAGLEVDETTAAAILQSACPKSGREVGT